MIKRLQLLALALLGIFLVACGSTTSTKKDSSTAYQTITLAEVNQKIKDKESFYLYVGRPTCEYCEIFRPKLEDAITKTKAEVFYVNTDEEKEADVTTFAEKENIKTVPNFSYYKEGSKIAYMEKGSESTPEEIQTFLQMEK